MRMAIVATQHRTRKTIPGLYKSTPRLSSLSMLIRINALWPRQMNRFPDNRFINLELPESQLL
jgi:hypothetical protein